MVLWDGELSYGIFGSERAKKIPFSLADTVSIILGYWLADTVYHTVVRYYTLRVNWAVNVCIHTVIAEAWLWP